MTYTSGPAWLLEEALLQLQPAPWLAVDIETYGLGADARRIKCVAVADQSTSVVLDPREPAQKQLFLDLLERYRGWLVFHRAAFDVPNLAINGMFPIRNCQRVLDTEVYARLAYPDKLVRKSLEALAQRYLGYTTDETIEVAFKRLGWTKAMGYKTMDIDSPMYLMGVAVDACITARIMPLVRQACYATLTEGHPFSRVGVSGDEAVRLVQREQRLSQRITLPRACKGLRVDLDFATEYERKTQDQLDQATAELSDMGIRPGNANDLIQALTKAGGLPAGYPVTPKTGKPSTTADNLGTLTHPIAKMYVGHKQITHILEDYLNKIRVLHIDGRIFPVVNLLKATTGRMSIGEPPLHQFPGDARGIVIADEGDSFTSIDWSQVEPALIANISKDMPIIHQYETGESDLYSIISGLAGVSRKVAKKILLAQLYGEGIKSLAIALDIPIHQAKRLAEAVLKPMPAVRKRLALLREVGAKHRKICTMSGRIVPIPMGKGWDGGPPSVATHKAVNYFVQGSAYDALAEALIRVIDAGLADAVYLTMHDEVVCSTSAAVDIERIMREPPEKLCQLAGRKPKLRTDRLDLGIHWAAA